MKNVFVANKKAIHTTSKHIHQEKDKVTVVVIAHDVIHPRAIVVHFIDAL